MGFHNYIQERTSDGSELTDFVLSVFRGENGASIKERMDAATWLAGRGFGKPTVNAAAQAPGFGDFTIDKETDSYWRINAVMKFPGRFASNPVSALPCVYW